MNTDKKSKERGAALKKDEISIYQEIQRNAEMAISAIDTISDKVYDDDLAMQIARQSLKYSDIRNRAMDKLLQGKAEPNRKNPFSEMMLKGGIQYNTMLNTSTSHIAELMIQGSSRGIVDMCKTLNRFPDSGGHAVEMAKELMDFEEKNIEHLKKYL